MRWAALLLFQFTANALSGETAILECTADRLLLAAPESGRARELRLPGVALLRFSTWNITGWRTQSAVILLHLAAGSARPRSIEVASAPGWWSETELPPVRASNLKFFRASAVSEEGGWLRVPVHRSVADQLTSEHAYGVVLRFRISGFALLHARESVSFAPYLILTGAPR